MLISLDYYPTSNDVEIGELIVCVSVTAANVVNDIRENIRNLIGGRMQHYERLIAQSIDLALADLDAKAKAKGYDGVIGVKISHPTVVDGGVEVIVYGNGFKRRAAGSA
ncbi:MAG: heavy metal-binding domain-containing protein [Caldilineaceae bacterium]|nr:heavy metal-binding domain-containing protein [Caldilineaceae bacterium]